MKAFALFLLSLLCLEAAAQDSDAWFLHFADGRAVVRRDSLYGYVDRSGAEVIPCRYAKAYTFNDGIAMVRDNFEVYAIDTLGNRLDRKVKIPTFRRQELDGFVSWVWMRIPFASRAEYERLQDEMPHAVITIDRDGRITACEKAGDSSDEAFRKVCDVVMNAPRWTPGEVDGQPVEIRYLLPVEFRKLRLPRCYAVDDAGNWRGGDLVFPLFEGGYANDFYGWFFRNLRFRNSLEYQRAASGPVRAAFTVDKKGRIRDIEILRYHNAVCRDKTVELLKKSPRWTPGTIDGEPVAVRYELTFTFKFR